MTPTTAVLLFLLFSIKHFIADFPLQPKFMWSNKGTYGHAGGIAHACVHILGTMLVLAVFTKYWLLLSLLDGIIHYHIDWAKMRLNAKWNLGPLTSEKFWWLLGADQLAHYMTYCLIVWMVI